MPDTIQEAVEGETDPSAMPNPSDNVDKTLIGVEVRRSPGRPAQLVLDCTEFHAHLRRLGVMENGAGEFEHIPGRRVLVANNAIQPYALLTSTHRQPLTVGLGDFFNGAATFQNLMDLAYSVDTCAKQVVEYYRPVEIKLRLVDKK